MRRIIKRVMQHRLIVKHIIKHKPKLKRALGLFSIVMCSVGIIIGAGIFSLLGVATGDAGSAVWISFLIAAFLALLSGLSYAELSSMFPRDAGEFDYTKNSISKDLAFFVGMIVIFGGIVSIATLAISFAGYLGELLNLPFMLMAMGVVIFFAFVNFYGIKQSLYVNIILTITSLVGIIAVIILGVKYWGTVDYFVMPNGFNGILAASALVFFAYIGFESTIKLTEETKNPTHNIPYGLLIAIVISSVIYILVSVSAVSMVSWQDLAVSKAPLALVASFGLGNIGKYVFSVIAILALFSISSTILMSLVATSRMVYGMASEGSLPKFLAKIHRTRRTPWAATIVITLITLLFVLIKNLEIVANLTTLSVFLTYITINISVIILRYKKPDAKRGFKIPLNIGKFPVVPALGIIISLVLLFYAVRSIFIAV